MSNIIVDALSHPSSGIATSADPSCAAVADRAPFDLRDMALFHILCPQVQSLCSSMELRIVTQKVSHLEILGDLHGAAQPGCFMTSRYVWKGLQLCHCPERVCLHCQRAKIPRYVQAPPHHFSHIHLDLVGPLPASKGFTHLCPKL